MKTPLSSNEAEALLTPHLIELLGLTEPGREMVRKLLIVAHKMGVCDGMCAIAAIDSRAAVAEQGTVAA